MKVSAGDKLHGTITDVTKGATTARVHIELGHGEAAHR
jgi:molybdopterin-binding protein